MQSSPIYIATCIWLPSGLYLSCSPWARICQEGKAFLRWNCWFWEVSLQSVSLRNSADVISYLCLLLQVTLWYVMLRDMQSELLAPMKLQKTGGILFYHICMLSLVSLQNDNLSHICLLLRLIQVHYDAYFTCGRANTGWYHGQMRW